MKNKLYVATLLLTAVIALAAIGGWVFIKQQEMRQKERALELRKDIEAEKKRQKEADIERENAKEYIEDQRKKSQEAVKRYECNSNPERKC